MNWFLVYLWTRLDVLLSAFLNTYIFSALIVVILFSSGMFFYNEDEDLSRRLFRASKIALIASGVLGLLYVITPSTKQACVIYLLPKIVNEKNIDITSSEMEKVYGMAREYLNDLLKAKRS